MPSKYTQQPREKKNESRIVGERLIRVRIRGTFLLKTVQPAIREAEGHRVRELRRIGKRIAIGLGTDLWLVLHLIIGGRLHWRSPQAPLAGRNNLAAFDFPNGSLILTEASTRRRASLHLLRGEEILCLMDQGGIDLFTCDLDSFRIALSAENRTLKRALTDPKLVSGIGNAYSDEILHAARLSGIGLVFCPSRALSPAFECHEECHAHGHVTEPMNVGYRRMF